MPQKHEVYSFKFDELSDDAKTRAVEVVAEKLGGDWWDSSDTDSIGETILYKLAEVLRSPGWDRFGEGDFPGIAGVKLDGWDVGRAEVIQVRGVLDRVNAPALPWSDLVGDVLLDGRRQGTNVGVELADGAKESEGFHSARKVLVEAVFAALQEALAAGRAQLEYMSSEEAARDYIDANDTDFREDGSLFGL